jgi:hypothetical protein
MAAIKFEKSFVDPGGFWLSYQDPLHSVIECGIQPAACDAANLLRYCISLHCKKTTVTFMDLFVGSCQLFTVYIRLEVTACFTTIKIAASLSTFVYLNRAGKQRL